MAPTKTKKGGGSKTNKKAVRKSPAESATLFKVGTVRKGLDGNYWSIAQASNGTNRWMKVKEQAGLMKRKVANKSKATKTSKTVSKSKSSKAKAVVKAKRSNAVVKTKSKTSNMARRRSVAERKTMLLRHKENAKKERAIQKTTKSFVKKSKATKKGKVYQIHDNGGRPFEVRIKKSGIYIYGRTGKDKHGDDIYDKPLLKITKYIGYWWGFDTSIYSSLHGNSLLIMVEKKKYVSIGNSIYMFSTDEQILDYVSPVGNSDVPYPVAYGSKYVYFMLDRQKVKKSSLFTPATPPFAEDIYGEFYGHLHPENKFKKIKFSKCKTLVPRDW